MVGRVTKSRKAEIARVTLLGPDLARVDLAGEAIGAGVLAGQFAMVEAPGRPDCVLLRPFSYFRASTEDEVSLLVKVVGKGTRSLVESPVGTPVTVLGPLGTAFPEPRGSCWMVVGGVGAAPCGGLAGIDGVRVLFGARTKGEAGFADALREIGLEVEVATDDGSAGFTGNVVELFAERLRGDAPEMVFSCGPTPMMEAVAAVCRQRTLPCWVSLEERMGCGFGVCRGCAHRDARGGWRCICEDGPVYEASIIFADPSGLRASGG